MDSMKLHLVLLGCLACGLTSAYASHSDESDVLIEQIGKYPSLVKAIQKLVKYVISNEPVAVPMDQLNNVTSEVNSGEESVTLEDASVTLEDASVTLQDAGVTLQDAGVTLEDASVTLEDASVTLEDSYEDDGLLSDYTPTEKPMIGTCMTNIGPLERDNCLNQFLLHNAAVMIKNLTEGITNKRDFEISIYVAAIDEYFRTSHLLGQSSFMDSKYKEALLNTLQTYFDSTQSRLHMVNSTVIQVRNGLSSLNKKIHKECGAVQAPGISCDQVVLKWYRNIIKLCPEYKHVMNLQHSVGRFGAELHKVKEDIYLSIINESASRTYALTQEKYSNLFNQGRIINYFLPKVQMALRKCKHVL